MLNSENPGAPVTLDDVSVQTRLLYNLADQALADSKPEWLACRSGCAFCCWTMNSMVSWIEAWQIFNRVREWSAEQKQALLERATAERTMLLSDPVIHRFATESGDISPDDLPVLNDAFRKYVRPCAFLDRATNRCSVYEDRPLVCRTFGQVAMQRPQDPGPFGYYCEVVGEDVDRRLAADPDSVNLPDATPFFNALQTLAGAPVVFALPLSFWVWEVAHGTEWNLDYPEGMFERLLGWFKPLQLEARRGAPPTATETHSTDV